MWSLQHAVFVFNVLARCFVWVLLYVVCFCSALARCCVWVLLYVELLFCSSAVFCVMFFCIVFYCLCFYTKMCVNVYTSDDFCYDLVVFSCICLCIWFCVVFISHDVLCGCVYMMIRIARLGRCCVWVNLYFVHVSCLQTVCCMTTSVHELCACSRKVFFLSSHVYGGVSPIVYGVLCECFCVEPCVDILMHDVFLWMCMYSGCIML